VDTVIDGVLRWLEFLATALMPCSRCGGYAAVGDVHATAAGLMCRRCLVSMPTVEFDVLWRAGAPLDASGGLR
jgi:late competence protein required for DNA uptake (superfamily II DNA/RNA helicase)